MSAKPRPNPDADVVQDFPPTDTPEARAAARVWKPVEDRIGDEHVYTWPKEGYGVGFNYLYEEKREVHGEITVVDDDVNPATGRPGLVHWGSFNLSSDQTRSRLAKTLAKKTQLKDEVTWENMLLYASFKTQEAYRAGMPEVDVAGHDAREAQWGVRDVLLKGEANVLFGPGGGLKSYCMDVMAVATACGHAIGPFEPTQEGPVLLVDYETSEDEITSRCKRIAAAAGLAIPRGGITYRQYWRNFADEGHTTRSLIDRYKCVMVGIDSIAYAVGGQVVPQFVMPFFNVLRSLGPHVTKVVISHITKAAAADQNAPATEFGSAFVRNSARASWEVSRGTPDASGGIPLAMFNRKINQGRERDPVYMTVKFDGDYGPVAFETSRQGDAPELLTKAAFIDRIRWALRGGPQTDEEIAVAVGVKPHQIRGELIRQSGRVVVPIRDGRDKEAWALLDRAHGEPPPPPADDDRYPEDGEPYGGAWGTDDEDVTF